MKGLFHKIKASRGTKRNQWFPGEDETITKLVNKLGTSNWKTISDEFNMITKNKKRSSKQ